MTDFSVIFCHLMLVEKYRGISNSNILKQYDTQFWLKQGITPLQNLNFLFRSTVRNFSGEAEKSM